MKNRIARVSLALSVITIGSVAFGGIVGGPQKRSGYLERNHQVVHSFECQKNEDCKIDVDFASTEPTCQGFKLKLWVDGDWLETIPASEREMAGCEASVGYGGRSKAARKNHKITVQVINESSAFTTYDLQTN
jgi:hypothetical protein